MPLLMIVWGPASGATRARSAWPATEVSGRTSKRLTLLDKEVVPLYTLSTGVITAFRSAGVIVKLPLVTVIA